MHYIVNGQSGVSRGEIRGAIKIQIRYIKPKCTLCVNNPLMKNDYNEDDILK